MYMFPDTWTAFNPDRKAAELGQQATATPGNVGARGASANVFVLFALVVGVLWLLEHKRAGTLKRLLK